MPNVEKSYFYQVYLPCMKFFGQLCVKQRFGLKNRIWFGSDGKGLLKFCMSQGHLKSKFGFAFSTFCKLVRKMTKNIERKASGPGQV